jgi:hypothetical protein
MFLVCSRSLFDIVNPATKLRKTDARPAGMREVPATGRLAASAAPLSDLEIWARCL